MTTAAVSYTTPTPPLTRRVRAYFAPVNRLTGQPTLFDPSAVGSFALDTPPAPWSDLGWIADFARKSDSTISTLNAGSPALPQLQMREVVGATVSLRFLAWKKLSMALSAGSEHMNLLTPLSTGTANGSGSSAAPATSVLSGSTASLIVVAAASLGSFHAGQMIAVDMDYSGQTGYVGSGVSAAYVRSAGAVSSSVDYIRRVTFNVALVASVGNGAITLAQPLPAGIPTAGMKVQTIQGFVDREGGSFFQEWSALFVMPGEQGERMLYHYPRLQSMAGAAESAMPFLEPMEWISLQARFRALPVVDGNDGQQVLCFRSFLPSPMTLL